MTAQEILRANSAASAVYSDKADDSNLGFQPILMSIDIDLPKGDLANSQVNMRKTAAQTTDLGFSGS